MRSKLPITLPGFFLLAVSVAVPQGATPKKYAVAEGKVTNAASGEAVVRALVTLKPVTQKTRDPEDEFAGYATETDDGGVFHFAKVPAGKYDLFVEKSGFLRTNYGAHRAAGPGVPIELMGEQTRSDLDMKMPPEGVISGRVTDDHGEPARSCSVSVLRRAWMNGRSTVVPYRTSETDSDGNFRASELSPGRYYVRADCLAGHMRSGRQPILVDREGNVIRTRQVATYFGDSTSVENASVITVQSGQEASGENIQIKKEAVYQVSGKLLAPAGESAAGYRLLLSPENAGFFFGQAGNAKVKADGTFELDNLPAGSYQMHVFHGSHGTSLPTPLDVNGDVQNFVAVVPPPIQVRGRIRIEGQPSTPVSAMSVHLIGSEAMFGGTAQVEEDGSLKFENVTPDQYELSLYYPGETAFVKSVRVGDREMPGKTVDLTHGLGAIEIVVSLNPGKLDVAVSKQDTETNQEVPAEAVNVVLVPEVRSRAWQSGVVMGSTDKQGKYTFKDVAPGTYLAFASDGIEAAQWADPEVAKALESHGVAIEIGEKETKQIQLKLIPGDEANQLLERLGL